MGRAGAVFLNQVIQSLSYVIIYVNTIIENFSGGNILNIHIHQFQPNYSDENERDIIGLNQEGYIEELTRFSQCLNAKTGFVHF